MTSLTVCVDAKFSDIDENAVEVFRKKWIEKSGNTRLKGVESEQLLRDCEAITEEGITYAALILFGKRYGNLSTCGMINSITRIAFLFMTFLHLMSEW